MRILVTGAAGFIGSHVCERLLGEKYQVIGIDNIDPYYNPEIKRNNLKVLHKYKNFISCQVSILDFEGLKKIFAGHKPDKIVHLAAKVGVRPSFRNKAEYESVNIKGTENLLKLSCEFKAKNFVFGSSSSVYGVIKGASREKDELKPISVYAITKKDGEALCRKYHDLCGLNVTILRFFTVYGPRGRPDMAIYKFTKLIDEGKVIEMYGEGSTRRDYTYVEDIVSGIINALHEDFSFEIFNLGNNNAVELKYIISVIEKNLGKKAMIKKMPMQNGDVPLTYADITKSKKLLKYNPKTRIEEGIKKFVEWYKKMK